MTAIVKPWRTSWGPSDAALWFSSVVALVRKLFINFWKPHWGLAFQTSQNSRLFSWNDINWNKMQPLFPAALVLAHWIPWFSNSYLNSMKLYHEDFHSALNLPMKSNLVHVLQRCKSKPIIFFINCWMQTGFQKHKSASTEIKKTQSIWRLCLERCPVFWKWRVCLYMIL